MSSCQRFIIAGAALVLLISAAPACIPDGKGGFFNCITGKTVSCHMPSVAKKADSSTHSSQQSSGIGDPSNSNTGQKPVIRTFAASPAAISAGDKTTLEWHTTWAATVSISPDIGTVSAAGNKILTPDRDTTYTITATNSSGTAEKSVSVTVSASTGLPQVAELPPSDRPSSHTYTPPPGAPALTEPGGSGPEDSPFPIEPSPTTAIPQPVISIFSASPVSIPAGSCSSLHWLVSGATSIRIIPGGSVYSSGSTPVCPGSTTTYTLVASNSSGAVQRTVTIYVTAPAPPPVPSTPAPDPTPTPAPPAAKPLLYFAANPASVAAGSCTILTWTATGATSVTMSPGGSVAASGSVQACPPSTTTYNVTATNAAGSVTLPVTVTVTAAPAPAPAPTPTPDPTPTPTPTPTPPAPADTAGCEQSLFNAVNARRAADGKAALTRNSYIDGLCRQHAQYTATQNALSHDNVDSRYAAIYANVPGIHAVAENVLQNNMPCDAGAMATQWFNSPGHKTNMLNAAYNQSGMGIVIDANGKIWACQLFAGP